jgi:malonyl-CoA/methylmalonyl-CoA synthetase
MQFFFIKIGTVGRPCGQIKVRVVDEINEKPLVVSVENNDQFHNEAIEKDRIFGELQIKGDVVFKEYFNKKEQTEQSFTEDGWFKTGDTAEFIKEQNIYKIIGRTSVDVIKSGGYKISALDIEKELLAYPHVADVAVMGIDDKTWGQRVFSLIVLKGDVSKQFDQKEFLNWCRSRLPKYSVPSLLRIIDQMPRNHMGKVNKKELIKQFESEYLKN